MNIIDETNQIFDDEIDIDYFNKIEFTGKNLIFVLNLDDIESFNDIRQITATFKSNDGLSNGEILYNIAQLIPNDDEIRSIIIEYIRKNSREILDQIEINRNGYIINDYRPYYNDISKSFLEDLIKSPDDFLEFMTNNSKNKANFFLKKKYITDKTEKFYPFLPDYSNYFGNYIFWEGLRRWEGEYGYHVILGT
jgi:hypothetical protein